MIRRYPAGILLYHNEESGMPNRMTDDERDKLDHSTHPTTGATKDDLRAPGAGAAEKPNGNKDPLESNRGRGLPEKKSGN